MTTSQATTMLSKPTAADKIPLGTLGYFRARNKQKAYSAVMQEFEKSGLSQADLARRLGKGTDVICRWLGAPGNWTLDTVSDLLFAIGGGAPEYAIVYPLEEPARYATRPEWLLSAPGTASGTTVEIIKYQAK